MSNQEAARHPLIGRDTIPLGPTIADRSVSDVPPSDVPPGERLGDRCRPAQTVAASAPIASVPRRFIEVPDAVLVVVDTSNKVVGTLRPRDLFRAVDIHGTSSLRDLTAGDVAGPAMIFHAQESAHAASILMAHERQDVAAVIDSRGSVCGVWTACDALATEGSARVEAARTALSASVNGRARDITEAVPSIGQEMPLRLLIGRLEAAPLGWLLVVDAAMRPVGVVTPAHLIGEVAGLGRGSLERLTVADVMASGVVCAGADASLEEVAELFAEKDCAFIAVCDGGGLMGIVRPERLLYIARTEGRRR